MGAEAYLAAMASKFGPIPERVVFGDTIDWLSPVALIAMHVELPFWLMIAEGHYTVDLSGNLHTVDVSHRYFEAFKEQFTESRATRLFLGEVKDREWHNKRPTFVQSDDGKIVPLMERTCRTTLSFGALCHTDALRGRTTSEVPRVAAEREAYHASLCEAHLALVNEFILRYRLSAYDYFSYEVSAWDVPVWTLRYRERQVVAHPSGYRALDLPPLEAHDSAAGGLEYRWPEFATKDQIESASSTIAAPGELDLLEARSFMERGNYTDAVRRTISAIETVLEHQALTTLVATFGETEGRERLQKTALDVPGRLRQWRKLAKAPITDKEIEDFVAARQLRHDIVHRSRRLGIKERGEAQRIVDTGRWLFNKIEGREDRARLRDYGAYKSIGRVLLSPRFDAQTDEEYFYLNPPYPLYVEEPQR
jgi:hypothetical protein